MLTKPPLPTPAAGGEGKAWCRANTAMETGGAVTLAEFLADSDGLVGQQAKVVGWLVSDGVRLWLADPTRPSERLVVVAAPEVTRWLRENLCPRLGGTVGYLAEAEVRGEAVTRNWEDLPVIGGRVVVTLVHNGKLVALQGGQAAPPIEPDTGHGR